MQRRFFVLCQSTHTINTDMLIKSLIVSTCLSISLAIVFLSTNPDKIPAIIFVVVFMLLYGLFVSLGLLMLSVLRRLDMLSWQRGKIMKTAFSVAGLPFILLLLQSLGQLTLKDVFLVMVLFFLLYFYFSRLSRDTQA